MNNTSGLIEYGLMEKLGPYAGIQQNTTLFTDHILHTKGYYYGTDGWGGGLTYQVLVQNKNKSQSKKIFDSLVIQFNVG